MSERRLPLEGIVVADFGWVLAVPRATSWLGALGARIIKIEGPRRPDQYRTIAIFEPGHANNEGSGAFHNLNYSKYGISIDFTHPKGLDLAKRIIALSDVVTENFAYGVMERIGLGYEEVRKVRPDVIMVSGSAVGKTGPDRKSIAYGALIHGFAGIHSVTGHKGDDSGTLGGTFTDPLTGNSMVLAILAALWRRRRTGEGQRIDMSMVEASMMQLPQYVMKDTETGVPSTPNGNVQGVAAPHDCFPCAGEEEWVAIEVHNETQWRAFCRALGEPEWTRDERFADQLRRFQNREAMLEPIRAWTRQRTPLEVTNLLQAAGVPAMPSYTAKGVWEDPQLQARGLFVEVDHPEIGRKPITGLPFHTEPAPGARYWAAPTLGQHTDQVLRELLDLPQGEIDDLRREGVIL